MSMSCGVPVVASSLADEGMPLTDGKDVLVTDTPADFAKTTIELYQNENLWNELSQNGLGIISEHYSFAALLSKLRKLLTDAQNRQSSADREVLN